MKVKDIDKLREKLHNDKREAFTKHQVWLMLSEHNTEVPTVDAVPMSVIDEIKAEINYVGAHSDYGMQCVFAQAIAIIDKHMERERCK
jgi:hypothetical protein